jgi:hypothetical protein
MHRIQATLVVLGSAVLLGGVSAVALAQSGGDTDQASDPVGPALTGLQRAAQPTDKLPPDVASFVSEFNPEADSATARKSITRDGKSVYLVEAGESVCAPMTIVGGPTTVSCETLDMITAGGNRPTLLGGADKVLLMNVVPDDVRSVTVTFQSGDPLVSPVENNVYLVEVDLKRAPISLSYETGSGRVEYPVELPTVPLTAK